MSNQTPKNGHSLSIIREAKFLKTCYPSLKKSWPESQKQIPVRSQSKNFQRSKRCLKKSIQYASKQHLLLNKANKGFGGYSKSPLQTKLNSEKRLNLVNSDRQICKFKNHILEKKLRKENDSFYNSRGIVTAINKLNLSKKSKPSSKYQINKNLSFLTMSKIKE